jgi:hypothetical protein
MTSLFLIPLVFLFLRGKKSNPILKALPSTSGLKFCCSSIEITDKKLAYSKIDSLIIEYCKNAKSEYEYVNLPDLFEYVVKLLNPSCYTKMITRKLKYTEKLVIAILFIIFFNRFLLFVKDPEEYGKDFEHNVSKTILHVIGLEVDDKDDIDEVNEQFKKKYKYP